VAFIVSWVLALFFLVCGLVEIFMTGHGGIIEPALLLTVYLLALPPWFRWSMRRRLAKPKNRAFFLPTIYEIDENEIRFMSEGGSSAIQPWSMIIEARPWRDGYLLMLTELTFHIFYPQRFATDGEWSEFEELVKMRPVGKPL
jgi:hypothetical protein